MKDYSILVACPTHVCKEYAMRRWIDNVKGFEYSNFKILMVDNSPNDMFISKYEKEIKTIHIKSDQHLAMKRVTESMEIIRKHFLIGLYDFWFNLEVDVLPTPRDIIQKMLIYAQDFDLVSHCYPSRGNDSIEHQGIGCSFISRHLAQNIDYNLAGDVSPDGWLWGKVRATSSFKMMELWNVFNIRHLSN